MSSATANGSETKKRRKERRIQEELVKFDFFSLVITSFPCAWFWIFLRRSTAPGMGGGKRERSSTANSNYLSSSRWKKQEEVVQDESRLGFAQGKKLFFPKSTKTPTEAERCCQQVPGIVATSHPTSHTPRFGGKWEPVESGKQQGRALSCSAVSQWCLEF